METYTKWQAYQKFIAGNEEQKIFNYNQAIQLYSDAIELNDELAQYYVQRGSARFNQLDFNSALQDARQATLLDESYIEGYLLTIKCCIALGDGKAVVEAIETLKELGITEKVDLAPEQEQLDKLGQLLVAYNEFIGKKDYDGSLSVMQEVIKISPGALNFQLKRAECMMWKKYFTEAMNIAQRIIKLDSLNAKAHFTLGLIYFHRGMLDEAMQSLECSLQNDQEYREAQNLRDRIKQIQTYKIQAIEYSNVGQYKEARRVYRNILDSYIEDNDELTSKMWFNCALMNSKLFNFEEAIDNCNAALQRNPKYYKAFLKRAQCQLNLKKYHNCLRDCIEAYNIEITSEVQTLFNKALKRSSNSLVNDRGADEFIKAGNDLHQSGLYTEAIEVFSKGIALSPMNLKLYEYRIECAIKSGDYQFALKDLATLTLIDNHNESRKLLKLKCLIFNGNLDEATALKQDNFKADNHFNDNYMIINKQFRTALKVRKYYDNKNYLTCLDSLRTLCKAHMKSIFYKLMEAECLYNTDLYKDSMVILNEVLQADPSNSKAYYLKGLIFFNTVMLDEAIIQFTQCLEFNSEIIEAQNMFEKTMEVKAKMDLGTRLFKAYYYKHANTAFDELLATLGNNDRNIRSSILHQQAKCAFACGEYDICIDNCLQILEMTESEIVQSLLNLAREERLSATRTVLKDTRVSENEKLKISEGLRCLNTSNYKKASESFSEAIKINSNNPLSYAYRAECNMQLKLYELAFSDAECSTKIDPNFSKGYFLAAKCCMIIGDIFKTDQTLQRIQKPSLVDPVIETIVKDFRVLEAAVKSASKFFNNMDYRECLVEIETALKIAHASDHFRLIKAECLVWLGEYTDALLIVEFLPPSNDKDYISGLTSYMQNNFLNASQFLDRCVENDPGHKSAKRLLSNLKSFKTRIDHGNESMEREKFDDALNIFTETMLVDKKNVVVNSELHLKCAKCNYFMGYLKVCLNECNSALKLVPDFLEATRLQEQCLIQIAKIKKEKEIATEAAMHISHGDASKNNANWEEAKASYTKAIELKSDNGPLFSKRAECNYKLGSLNECSSDCDNALKLVPNFPQAIVLRAQCKTEIEEIEKVKKITKDAEMHIKNGDVSKNKTNWEEAIASYTRAIHLKPDNASCYAKRAECNYKLGFLKECLSDCDIALILSPELEEVIKLRDQCKTAIDGIVFEKKCEFILTRNEWRSRTMIECGSAMIRNEPLFTHCETFAFSDKDDEPD